MSYSKEDFQKKLIKIDFDAREKKKKAIIEYCNANNPYKVGDIFQDHIGKILIEKIEYNVSTLIYDYCCIYYGVELKADGTARKDRKKRYAYQSNEYKGGK